MAKSSVMLTFLPAAMSCRTALELFELP